MFKSTTTRVNDKMIVVLGFTFDSTPSEYAFSVTSDDGVSLSGVEYTFECALTRALMLAGSAR